MLILPVYLPFIFLPLDFLNQTILLMDRSESTKRFVEACAIHNR